MLEIVFAVDREKNYLQISNWFKRFKYFNYCRAKIEIFERIWKSLTQFFFGALAPVVDGFSKFLNHKYSKKYSDIKKLVLTSSRNDFETIQRLPSGFISPMMPQFTCKIPFIRTYSDVTVIQPCTEYPSRPFYSRYTVNMPVLIWGCKKIRQFRFVFINIPISCDLTSLKI